MIKTRSNLKLVRFFFYYYFFLLHITFYVTLYLFNYVFSFSSARLGKPLDAGPDKESDALHKINYYIYKDTEHEYVEC